VTISLVGTPTTAEATGTTGLTNNVPTGVADNDFLVWVEGQTTATVIATPPTGFTLLQSLGNVAVSMHLWYRIAASEPASYTTPARTASRAAGVMSAFRGVDLTNPWDVAAATFVTAPPRSPALPAHPSPPVRGSSGSPRPTSRPGSSTPLSSSNLTAIDGQVTSTAAASTNNVCGCGHFLWTSRGVHPGVHRQQRHRPNPRRVRRPPASSRRGGGRAVPARARRQPRSVDPRVQLLGDHR
jgi:hypothetical protein